MEYVLLATAITLLIVSIAAGWGLTLMGLPGNWLMVASTALYSWLAPTTGVTQISWATTISLAVLAALGELIELAAGVWGARRAGGSRRAAVFSLIGSITGAIVGAALGLPVPVLGPPLAALLGGATGALIGAGVAEHTLGESSEKSLKVGGAAFLGRLLGTGAKTVVATIMAVIAIVALVL